MAPNLTLLVSPNSPKMKVEAQMPEILSIKATLRVINLILRAIPPRMRLHLDPSHQVSHNPKGKTFLLILHRSSASSLTTPKRSI